jgi:hypothetical protein
MLTMMLESVTSEPKKESTKATTPTSSIMEGFSRSNVLHLSFIILLPFMYQPDVGRSSAAIVRQDFR